jgi:hypothetical protein
LEKETQKETQDDKSKRNNEKKKLVEFIKNSKDLKSAKRVFNYLNY